MADSGSVNKVTFHFLYKFSRLKNRTILKRFVLSIFKLEGKKLAKLTVVFCSDDYLLTINQRYLKHNTYTDIITFDLSTEHEGITGEIYISLERIVENAPLYSVPVKDELHRVLFHGVLHLCGYGDKSSVDKKRMRAKETWYINKYNTLVSRETRST